MNLNEIGYFQFENLIRNRVPFVLLNLGADLSNFFEGLSQKHLQSVEIQTTETAAIADLKAKNLDKSYAVILICQNGDLSGSFVKAVEGLGYVNVYTIHRGLKGLVEEKST